MSEDVTVAVTVENPAAEQIVTTVPAFPVEVKATVVDPSPGFFGVYVAPEVEKIEQTVEAVVEAVETEAVQVEQAVVAEVEEIVAFVETEAKEGYVAAENLVRKVLNHHIAAGGGSVIKNPAAILLTLTLLRHII